MTVDELIEALTKLPKDAHAKPVKVIIDDGASTMEADIDMVDYDLRVVTLR